MLHRGVPNCGRDGVLNEEGGCHSCSSNSSDFLDHAEVSVPVKVVEETDFVLGETDGSVSGEEWISSVG